MNITQHLFILCLGLVDRSNIARDSPTSRTGGTGSSCFGMTWRHTLRTICTLDREVLTMGL